MLVTAGKDAAFPATGIFLDQGDIAIAVAMATGRRNLGIAVVQLMVKHRQHLLLLWAARPLHTAPVECQAGRSTPICSPLQHLLGGRNHPSFCLVLRVLSPSAPHPTQGGWRRAQCLQWPFPGDAHAGRWLFPTTAAMVPSLTPALTSPRPDTAVPVDAPTSQCWPVVGPWGVQSCSRRHQPREAHTDLLPHAEGSYEPLLPQGPSPPASPHAAPHCLYR